LWRRSETPPIRTQRRSPLETLKLIRYLQRVSPEWQLGHSHSPIRDRLRNLSRKHWPGAVSVRLRYIDVLRGVAELRPIAPTISRPSNIFSRTLGRETSRQGPRIEDPQANCCDCRACPFEQIRDGNWSEGTTKLSGNDRTAYKARTVTLVYEDTATVSSTAGRQAPRRSRLCAPSRYKPKH
jgi:hypothetical protein